jgi:hypothetical protein
MNKLLILIAILFLVSCGATPEDPTPSSNWAKQRSGETATRQPSGTAIPDLGANASLCGKRIFPSDNPWNQDISAALVDPNYDYRFSLLRLESPIMFEGQKADAQAFWTNV